MKRLSRRSAIGILAAGTVAAVAPAVVGWRTLLAGPSRPGGDKPGPEELDSFIGAIVLEVVDAERFRARTPYGEADIYVPPTAKEIWAGAVGPYVPSVGDTFDAAGAWEGEAGETPFTADRIYFNLVRFRGRLTSNAEALGESITFGVAPVDQTWQETGDAEWSVRVDRATLTGASDGSDRSGMELVSAARTGWGIDMIGFREPDGTLLVTWVEFYPPDEGEE